MTLPANSTHMVEILDAKRAPEVVTTLCDAFWDYPVMRHVLAQSPGDYRTNLTTLVGFFVAARVWRGEPMIGIMKDRQLTAAAIMTPPGDRPVPPEMTAQRERVWRQLGSEAEKRYQHLGEVWPKVGVTAPNLHLNMIGVRREQAGAGLGGMLLAKVHAMSSADAESTGVSLTTEIATNVPFYEYFGYRMVGHEPVVEGLETWGFFRADEAADQA